MRVPDGASGPGGGDGPLDDFPFWTGAAREGWRGWVADVAVVARRAWRAVAAILLITMVLPLSLLIADGATAGAAVSPDGRVPIGLLALVVLGTPVVLMLAVGCGLVVARGWIGAVWAAASAGSGRPGDLRDALRWSRGRYRLLWANCMIGVAVLAGAAFLAGYLAPGASTVPDLLVLAGPAGLLALLLCFVPTAAWRRGAPGAEEPPAADLAQAARERRACLTPMVFVLAVVVGFQVAAALALSWLMTSASAARAGVGISGPVAAVIASLVALPGFVLLAAATFVSYARCGARSRR